MKKQIIAGSIVGILLLFTALLISEWHEAKQPTFNDSGFTSAINNERAMRDLEPVVSDPALDQVAQSKCNDMVSRKYFSHADPEGDMVWKDLPQDRGYGENLAIGYYSSYETVQHWVHSPEHFKNIINPNYVEVGHATCFNGNQYMNVEVFEGR